MSKIIRYFVEGECEKKFIDAFKVPPHDFILPGKVMVFNFINQRISKARIASVRKDTSAIILVYDIDVEKTNILEENIKTLKTAGFNEIYHVQSIKNFEDEIVHSSNIKKIDDMFNTSSVSAFKAEFINHGDIVSKLNSVGFRMDKMWSQVNTHEPFKKYSTQKALDLIKK